MPLTGAAPVPERVVQQARTESLERLNRQRLMLYEMLDKLRNVEYHEDAKRRKRHYENRSTRSRSAWRAPPASDSGVDQDRGAGGFIAGPRRAEQAGRKSQEDSEQLSEKKEHEEILARLRHDEKVQLLELLDRIEDGSHHGERAIRRNERFCR
jgi:hypothetical protein